MAHIHPTALVDADTCIPPSTIIGPFCLIGAGVTLGPDCIIESGARLYAGVQMGAGNHVHSGAMIGGPPQDIAFDPGVFTGLVIGDHNIFREQVTIHRATRPDRPTRLGSHNFLMVNAHVAHDCQVGDHNIFANGATLAGHVELDHHVFLSGHTAVHQFCRIGAYVMVAGVTGVSQDVPPYVTVDGHRARMVGLNTVGLRRNGFSQATRSTIQQAYRMLYEAALPRADVLARLAADPCPEVQAIAQFLAGSRRGLVSGGYERPSRAIVG